MPSTLLPQCNSCSMSCSRRGAELVSRSVSLCTSVCNPYASRTLVDENDERDVRQHGVSQDTAEPSSCVALICGSTGIGGGCMFLLWNTTTNTTYAMDGREEAPSSFSPSAFCSDANCSTAYPFMPDRVSGGHPVGVPGTLATVDRALRQFGTISLARALAPAISIARDGFPMYRELYDRINWNLDRLAMFPASAALFLSPDRTKPIAAIGETFYNPDLAATLQEIADHGIQAFYG
jgi:gamma-glutamyltranspeptidase